MNFTKQDMLKIYLMDPIFKEIGLLTEDDVSNFKWNTSTDEHLIIVLKKIIEKVHAGVEIPDNEFYNLLNALNWSKE